MGMIKKHKNGDGIEENVLTVKSAIAIGSLVCTLVSAGWYGSVQYYKGQAELVIAIEAKIRAGDIAEREFAQQELARVDKTLGQHDQRIRDLETTRWRELQKSIQAN